tara:strand:- start:58 stop:261 length:204 start_codon:yes stop_codon:yes gene_type:complete
MKHFTDHIRCIWLRIFLEDGQHIRQGFWRHIDDGRRKVWVKATKVSNPVQPMWPEQQRNSGPGSGKR